MRNENSTLIIIIYCKRARKYAQCYVKLGYTRGTLSFKIIFENYKVRRQCKHV